MAAGFLRVSKRERVQQEDVCKQEEVTVLYNLVSLSDIHQVCSSLFLGSQSLDAAHSPEEGVTKGCEHKETTVKKLILQLCI